MDRLADHLVVVLHDIGLDRHAVHRRLLENAHIADPDETHVQSSRDRRRRQRQNIHVLLHLLDLLFVGHAEPLLLVDDQQSQTLKLHVLREHPVCAYHDVHIAFFQPLDGLFHLPRCPESRHHVHPHREIFHSLDEGIVDLLRQDRRRNQVHYLFSLLHRLEGRPERDLRLSVSDVTADQAVHDLLALHVPLRVIDGGELVIRLIVGEHFLEFLLPYRVRAVLKTFRVPARRVELHELLRDLPDCRADLRLRLRPLSSAEFV